MQPVEAPAWSAIELLAQQGGWNDVTRKKDHNSARPSKSRSAKVRKGKNDNSGQKDREDGVEKDSEAATAAVSEGTRRSTRSMVRAARSSRAS